ncbi:hypothetical protein [Flavobacterium sp. UBA7663]|uniref:hypothetical protein n=1 Tax=Flavobacterium sp. UBA7663 TaxID=1946557 RepID=UPI0025C61C5E|nr:hypothetical protein [Flavobacterium sp. UBA7663]
MAKSLTKIGQEEFEKNKENFLKRIKQKIVEDESPLDDTVKVKVHFSMDKDFKQYFKFNIITPRMNFTSDYYPNDFDFRKGEINNVDEIEVWGEASEILIYFGNEL